MPVGIEAPLACQPRPECPSVPLLSAVAQPRAASGALRVSTCARASAPLAAARRQGSPRPRAGGMRALTRTPGQCQCAHSAARHWRRAAGRPRRPGGRRDGPVGTAGPAAPAVGTAAARPCPSCWGPASGPQAGPGILRARCCTSSERTPARRMQREPRCTERPSQCRHSESAAELLSRLRWNGSLSRVSTGLTQDKPANAPAAYMLIV
jgi:hypothetical protein